MSEKNLGPKKARSFSQLYPQLLTKPTPGKKNHRLRTIFEVRSRAKDERGLLERTVRGHGVNFFRGLSSQVHLRSRTQRAAQARPVPLDESTSRSLDIYHSHAWQGRIQIPGPSEMKGMGDKSVLENRFAPANGEGECTNPMFADRVGRTLLEGFTQVDCELSWQPRRILGRFDAAERPRYPMRLLC